MLVTVGVAVVGFMAQFLLVNAYSMIKPSKVMPIGYIGIVISFLADIYLFDTKFTLLPIIGMLLTSVGLLSDFLMNGMKKVASSDQKNKILMNGVTEGDK